MLQLDAANSYLVMEGLEAGPMGLLLGTPITVRIAVRPQQGRKVFTRQKLPVCDEPFDGDGG